jgi:ubiquinone/menaquinone biosynthesis C-methylase UbiE
VSDNERRRVRAVFDRYAASPRKQRAWSAANPGNSAIRSELVERAFELAGRELSSGQVLDVGCGNGWWLRRLADSGITPTSLHGLDLLEERVGAAAAKVPGASIQVGDARSLPFEARRFAAVTLLLVLSSLGDRTAMRQALAEARRVLAVDGALLIWEPRIPNPANRATTHVPQRLLRHTAGRPSAVKSVTLMPPLARRLPNAAAYRRIARLRPLRTHRLIKVSA